VTRLCTTATCTTSTRIIVCRPTSGGRTTIHRSIQGVCVLAPSAPVVTLVSSTGIMRRHHTNQAVNRGSSSENQRGGRTLSIPYPLAEWRTDIFVIELGENRTNTPRGTRHRPSTALGQRPSRQPGYPESASFPNNRKRTQGRLAEEFRGMKIRDEPLPGNFRTPHCEVRQESWEEEEKEEEIDDDRTYTTEDGSSTQRSTSMNANRPPASPSPPPSSTGINPGASETEDPFSQAMGVQTHHYPAQTWYNGPVWNNDSYNTTTTDTQDSHNNSSINIGDSE